MCQEVIARALKRYKQASTGGKYKEGAIQTDKLKILWAGFTTYGNHLGDTGRSERITWAAHINGLTGYVECLEPSAHHW